MAQSSDGHFVYTIHSAIPHDSKQSFEDLQDQMNKEARCFEGYRGQTVTFHESEDGQQLSTTVRIVFEALDQCLRWLDSPVRRQLLHEAERLMNYQYQVILFINSQSKVDFSVI